MFDAKAKDIEDDIRQLIPEAGTMQNDNHSSFLRREEIVVIVRRVTMGMGSRNPIERVIMICLKNLFLIFLNFIQGSLLSLMVVFLYFLSGNIFLQAWKRRKVKSD